ncbi:MAG: fumarylacetoacetase [Granulosicoccus sp.]
MKSWIESANRQECHFPLQNLPFGVAILEDGSACCVTAIGDKVLNLSLLEAEGLVCAADDKAVFDNNTINDFMALGPRAWQQVRESLTGLLAIDGNPALKDNAGLLSRAIVSMQNVTMQMPFKVAEYTDFYSGRQHATNVGTMFRGAENALPPNWLHIPIGYNGRASTVVVSGTLIRRPLGQLKPAKADAPYFGPSKRLDIELEMGAVIGLPSNIGETLTVEEADAMIFGYVLLNDWSARDIQAWEYQPLGPFQAKAFATSISPWVISKAALELFRVSTPPRETPLLPYLSEPRPMLYDVKLQIQIQPLGATTATVISETNYSTMYYSAAQQLAHHASSGCKMNTGDLLGSGTISGIDKTTWGSLLEISWGGKEPMTLDTGETRTFIEDGDTLALTGWAQGDGYRIGFGECLGTVVPAIEPKSS